MRAGALHHIGNCVILRNLVLGRDRRNFFENLVQRLRLGAQGRGLGVGLALLFRSKQLG